MSEVHYRQQASHQVLLVTLWLSLLVLAIKAWAGWATAAYALQAEALHTLIDCFSTLLSLLAMTSRYRTLGREVWGHGKRESIAVLIMVAFLGFAGLSLGRLAIDRATQVMDWRLHGTPLPFAIAINSQLMQLLAIVMLIHLCLAVFERYQANVLENMALRLNANHQLHDAWFSLLILLGLMGIAQGYIWLDPLLSIITVLAAFGSCWRVLNWQLPLLVRQIAIAPEALAQTAHQVEGITHCYQIQSRGIVGRQVFVEMHLILHPEFMGMARMIASRVEDALRERYGPVYAVIYVDSPNG